MEEKDKTKTGQRRIAKFTGTLDMDAALDRMVTAANDGFSGGRVSKHDMVSWAVVFFEKHCFAECLERVRQDHFDQVAYLESVLRDARRAQKAGGAAPDLVAALAPLISSGRAAPLRRGKKAEQAELLNG